MSISMKIVNDGDDERAPIIGMLLFSAFLIVPAPPVRKIFFGV